MRGNQKGLTMHLSLIVIGVVFPLTLAWSPFPFTLSQQDVVEPSPRIFGRLKYLNPLSFIVLRQPSEPRTILGFCERIGGVMFGEECLEFISTPRNFFEANRFCGDKGGTLWVPTTEDMGNPFFFQKLLASFPTFFKGMSSEVLVGISRGRTSGYKGVDGTDVSTTPWVRTNDEPEIKHLLECAVFDYSLGHLQFQPVKCEDKKNFVCEYYNNAREDDIQTYEDRPSSYRPKLFNFFDRPFKYR